MFKLLFFVNYRNKKTLRKLLVGNKLKYAGNSSDVDNSIPLLSHFSHKRKEFNIDRFERIFEKFDLEMDPFKTHKRDKYKKMCKFINKSYIEDADYSNF